MKKVLLYGQGSYDNRGCEAIVISTANQIKKVGDSVISATFDYENNKKKNNDLIDKYINHYYKEYELKGKYKELNEYYKTIPFDYMNFEKLYQYNVIDEIKMCDICLSIGGDNYCYGYSRWLYAINDEIKKKNKKNVLWCASLFEEIEDDEIIDDMKNFDVILAREPITYRALEKYVSKKRLMLVPDPAFSLAKKKIDLPNIFNKKVIGINVSPLVLKKDSNTYDSIISLVEYILLKTDSNVALIPHVFLEESNDMQVLEKIKKQFKKEDRVQLLDLSKNNCEEIKYVISNCEFIVAARTHASIAAYSTCVPTLVIGYSVKSKGIAEYLFDSYDDYVISYDSLNQELLKDKFMKLYNSKETIKKDLETKMKKISKQAKELYKNLLNKLDELEKTTVTLDSYCTGCGACLNACPTHAITMKENKDGFMYPHINLKKCVNCGLCKKVCPSNCDYSYKYKNLFAYAGNYNNSEFDNYSSSGAIFPLLAKKLLEKKWVVYGVNSDEHIQHIRISSESELNKILGSKYVQSDTNTTFLQVKKDLENNKKVLYSGVPCQIEGLKRYLNKGYKNLYCLSVICHGVPNEKILKTHLKEAFNDTNEKDINYRYKTTTTTNIKYNKYNKVSSFEEDEYMSAFMHNFSLRESCFKCEFKLYKKNTSDLILGDYWGYKNYHDFDLDSSKNVSCIICNSKKGEALYKLIENDIDKYKTNIKYIINGNPVLISKIKYSKLRELFLNNISRVGFKESLKNSVVLYDNDNLNSRIIYLENRAKELEMQNNELKNELYDSNNELTSIINSRKWKLASKLFDPLIKIKSIIKK